MGPDPNPTLTPALALALPPSSSPIPQPHAQPLTLTLTLTLTLALTLYPIPLTPYPNSNPNQLKLEPTESVRTVMHSRPATLTPPSPPRHTAALTAPPHSRHPLPAPRPPTIHTRRALLPAPSHAPPSVTRALPLQLLLTRYAPRIPRHARLRPRHLPPPKVRTSGRVSRCASHLLTRCGHRTTR